MDHAEIERRALELEGRRNRLEEQVVEIEQEISALRGQCAHERDTLSNGAPAWWCRWCGGEVKG